MSAGKVCPVCLWPSQRNEPCRCGRWPADSDNAARLLDWQHAYDLNAAVRAASATSPDDQVLLSRLGAKVRGPELSADQVKAAMSDAGRLAATSAGTAFAMTRLVAGKTSAVAFVEIGPDLLAWQALVTRESGLPVPAENRDWKWTDILPSLPAEVGLRYLRMAGGVGLRGATEAEAPSPVLLMEELRGNIERVLDQVKSAAAIYRPVHLAADPAGRGAPASPLHDTSVDTVLVLRTQDWPLLDEAAAVAQAALRPVTKIIAGPEAGTLADIVRDVAARAPLRYGYDLVLVETDEHTGAVRPRSRELFPAGAGVTDALPVQAVVPVSPVVGHAASQLTIPIVARRDPLTDLRDIKALPEQRPLVNTAELHTAVGGPFYLRVELDGPGQLRLLNPMDFVLADRPGDWPGVLADLPERLTLPPHLSAGCLDLALLVELGGARSKAGRDVAARLRLVKDVIREFQAVQEVRIAVLGYRDHGGFHERHEIGRRGREHRALVVGTTAGFGTPQDLQWRLGRNEWWHPVKVRHDHAAPIEEALSMLAHDNWNWQPEARHVVLTVGQRPPHPAKEGPHSRAHRCANKLSWEEDVDRLRKNKGVQFLAVLADEPRDGYAADAWRALSSEGRFQARGLSARTLAEHCGLAPESPVLLPLAQYAVTAPPANRQDV